MVAPQFWALQLKSQASRTDKKQRKGVHSSVAADDAHSTGSRLTNYPKIDLVIAVLERADTPPVRLNVTGTKIQRGRLLMPEETALSPVELATKLTIAWLGNQNNRPSAEDVPLFLRTMHETLSELASDGSSSKDSDAAVPETEYTPAVSVRKSLASNDHIISMIDGKPYKTLRRHISTHGMTPEDYRARYNLNPDYPLVAPNYSEMRRAMARRIGLGAKGRVAPSVANPGPAPTATKKRKRRAKTAENG